MGKKAKKHRKGRAPTAYEKMQRALRDAKVKDAQGRAGAEQEPFSLPNEPSPSTRSFLEGLDPVSANNLLSQNQCPRCRAPLKLHPRTKEPDYCVSCDHVWTDGEQDAIAEQVSSLIGAAWYDR